MSVVLVSIWWQEVVGVCIQRWYVGLFSVRQWLLACAQRLMLYDPRTDIGEPDINPKFPINELVNIPLPSLTLSGPINFLWAPTPSQGPLCCAVQTGQVFAGTQAWVSKTASECTGHPGVRESRTRSFSVCRVEPVSGHGDGASLD